MSIYTPYTYLIGWSAHKKYYYGVRYAKGCHPSDLFNPYQTSSKFVKAFIQSFGLPDIIEVRKIFTDEISAQNWEKKVLTKLNVLKSDIWLNENIGGIFTNKKPLGFGKGSKNSMYGKKRPDRAEMNRNRINPFLNKKRPEHSLKMKGKNNPMSELGKGLFFWNNGIINIRSRECPGIEWRRGHKPKN